MREDPEIGYEIPVNPDGSVNSQSTQAIWWPYPSLWTKAIHPIRSWFLKRGRMKSLGVGRPGKPPEANDDGGLYL